MTNPILTSSETCWTLLRDAAKGSDEARERFARVYLGVVRTCLGARWQDNRLLRYKEDAAQEVFLDCLRRNGALTRLEEGRGRFRPFLRGVVRTVARRFEQQESQSRLRQPPSSTFDLNEQPARDERLSVAFDRAWARAVVRAAVARQAALARAAGEAAERRVRLLRLRFGEGRPIREIAKAWGVNAPSVQREYARAREEFKAALREEIRCHHAGSDVEIEEECRALISFLRDEN